TLARAIGLGVHAIEELLARRQVGLIDAVTVDVVFPAVIDTANAAFLIAAEEERGAAMRAAMIHDADAASRVAEGDQLFTEEHEAHRVAIGDELTGFERRQPIMAHEIAHRRARTDSAQDLGILQRRHGGGSPEASFGGAVFGTAPLASAISLRGAHGARLARLLGTHFATDFVGVTLRP